MSTPPPPPSRPRPGDEPPIFPGGRDRSIPIASIDLNRYLLAHPGLGDADREAFRQLQWLFASLFHQEFHPWQVELNDLYARIDPDGYADARRHRGEAIDDRSDEAFLTSFEAALIQANYQKLEFAHLEAAVDAPNGMGLNYAPNFELFEHLRVYVRGRCQIDRRTRSIGTLFRTQTRTFEAYRRVVIVLKFVPKALLDEYMRSDVVYLRMYRDVPFAEMDMHLPEQAARIRMRWQDRAQIASPLLTGAPAFVMKFLAVWAASFSPILLASLLAIPVGVGLKSFFGHRQTKHRYFAAMIRHLYYLTQANNSSVIARLIDSAEEEEYKEAILAYFLLWQRADEAWDEARLDTEVEAFLNKSFTIDTDFEIRDALVKLRRYRLLAPGDDRRLSVIPPAQALVVLDQQWDALFRHARSAKVAQC